ncbi:MAG: tRNA pseudouridine(55) synthase TruB [Candidatus Rokubacteria bacterium]|nr:tRNA pseudouridine(55) synthase TruB [Candidatus Rokubacteria bacterium]
MGGAVERLVRSRVGPFALRDAVAWAELTQGEDDLWARVRPAEAALTDWPRVDLDERSAAAFGHGQAVDVAPADDGEDRPVRVYDRAGALIGVGALSANGRRVRPVRILHADRPGTRILPA